MEAVSPKQVLELREHLEMSQEEFADHMSVSRASVGTWELGKSKPRGENRENLIEAYQSAFPKTNGKAKTNGAHSKGGRHKVSVARVQECLSDLDMHLLGTKSENAARFVAQKYELDFATFREALVVFCYGMDNMAAKTIAQALSGHE
jgi:transcriptional regulator with XRE-family HTH domain